MSATLPAQTQRFQEKREAILSAAAALFNQHGVKGATLADIAASVGLVTNSVTYYYRKKEDLATACFLRAIEVFRGIIEQASHKSGIEARVSEFFRL
ncbi:MAG TPA: TetR/AcrR family transcriptional regulator, partial [Rhizobacter sp.]